MAQESCAIILPQFIAVCVIARSQELQEGDYLSPKQAKYCGK